jgi:lathosterol oxidase
MIKSSGVVFLTCFVGMVLSSTVLWEAISPQEKIELMHKGVHRPVWEFNEWVSSLFLPQSFILYVEQMMGLEFAHYFLAYVRDLMVGSVIYYVTAGLWHIWIYRVKGKELFIEQGWKMPSNETLLDQILLAQASLFMYAMLPVFSEWLISNKITKCYFYIDEIGGWIPYLLYTAVYMMVVETGVYWMHRELHEQKWAYKYIHALHHKYNRPDTLSPWASIAFNPLDGILQACPYVICLFFIPCHYLTHVILVFATAVWATNIHDALEADTEPIMGSKYHTMHHTHYHCNFGQYTIFCDWLWGTLKVPAPRKKEL